MMTLSHDKYAEYNEQLYKKVLPTFKRHIPVDIMDEHVISDKLMTSEMVRLYLYMCMYVSMHACVCGCAFVLIEECGEEKADNYSFIIAQHIKIIQLYNWCSSKGGSCSLKKRY